MTNFVETVKEIAVNAVEAGKPTQVLFGTVAEAAPLRVKLSQTMTLSKEFFLALDPVPNLREGDRLILLRVQGGQQYLILGRKGAL